MSTKNNSDWVNNISGNEGNLFFMLGPCSIENELHSMKAAEFLKELSEKLNFNLIFKSSFDKANRTSMGGYRSVGFDQGLKILQKVKDELELPIVTDIHESWQAEPVAQVADVLQIPAFLCRQTDLLIASGKTGKAVNIKKGQFVTADNMKHAADKVASTGNEHVWLCERGFSFGYNNLVVDPRNFPIMKQTGKPVVIDATHSVQRPGGLASSSGGDRNFVATLAATAVVQGIAGVFMEVHDEPEKAPCDGPNMVRFSQLEGLIKYLMDLDAWVKQHPVPPIS